MSTSPQTDAFIAEHFDSIKNERGNLPVILVEWARRKETELAADRYTLVAQVAGLRKALKEIVDLEAQWPQWEGKDLYDTAHELAKDALAASPAKEGNV